MSNVSFLGLGVMGYPIAGHLARAGLKVTVFNRTIEKAKNGKKNLDCSFEPDVSNAVKESDFVFSCVGNDNDLREIIYGEEGAFKNMKKGSCFIDHTTASSSIAKELQMKANELDIGFIDAPVSGGEIGAINGKLTIMCGGRETIYKRALPTYAKIFPKLYPHW